MEIILYDRFTKAGNDTFVKTIKNNIPDKDVKIYRTLKPLKKRLLDTNISELFLLILPRSIDDLIDFYFMGHLLHKHRIAYILPDRERESLAIGYRLRAYILGFSDDNCMDIVKGLKKLLTHTATTKQADRLDLLRLSAIYGKKYSYGLSNLPEFTLNAA